MPSSRFPIPLGTLDRYKQSQTGREANSYSLTPAAHRQFARDSWSRAVNLILEEGNR